MGANDMINTFFWQACRLNLIKASNLSKERKLN